MKKRNAWRVWNNFESTSMIYLLSRLAVFFYLVREIVPPAQLLFDFFLPFLSLSERKQKKTTKLYNQIQITPTSARALHPFLFAYGATGGRSKSLQGISFITHWNVIGKFFIFQKKTVVRVRN
jgi:hypothetical protein